MLTLIWPDGTSITGATWRELEDALRASQWTTYPSRRAFRREMRRRAQLWTGRKHKPILRQSSQDFIRSLVHAEMAMLVEDDELPTTTDRSTS